MDVYREMNIYINEYKYNMNIYIWIVSFFTVSYKFGL